MCALTEAGELALQLGTSVQNLISDTSLNMIDTIFTVRIIIFFRRRINCMKNRKKGPHERKAEVS